MSAVFNFGVRDPSLHPEDTNEIKSFKEELNDGVTDTAAKVGFVLLDTNGLVNIPLQFVYVEFRGSGYDQRPQNQDFVYTIITSSQLDALDHLWQVVGATDTESVIVSDLTGVNPVTLVFKRYIDDPNNVIAS